MKVLTTIAVLSMLVSSGCCLKADSCTEVWEQDAMDAPVALDGGGDGRVDGPNMSIVDGGADGGGLDAMVDAYVPDAMPECTGNMSCGVAAKPFCDKAIGGGTCRECRADVECTGRVDGKVTCNNVAPLVGECGECNVSADCKNGLKPVCEAHVCRPCVQDSECGGPGICLDHLGGRCASESEVLYVEVKLGCEGTNGPKGTKQNPFCSPAPAIEEAKKDNKRRVIVLLGTDDVASFGVSLPVGESISIIGKGPAIVSNSSNPGVDVTQGTVYLRGVKVANAPVSTGIIADGPDTTLFLIRSIVQKNKNGGIRIKGKAAFTIKDSLVVDNGTDQASFVSGILVEGTGVSKTQRVLQNVSILNNKGSSVGLNCESEIMGSGVLAFSGDQKSLSGGCSVTNCCDAPKFSSTYKLQSSSDKSCIDQVSVSQNTLDVFGQLRTGPGDCGADELDLP